LITLERRKRLIELLRTQPGLRVPELAQSLGVSQGTVRNDLNALDAEGHIKRVRGGAVVDVLPQPVPTFSPSFSARAQKNAAAKNRIARWAAELVEDGDSILLDASTTVYAIAQYLNNRRKLRVITNGIEVARALAQNPTNTVILLGGILNPEGSSITGSIGAQFLEDLHIQTAFVSCSGVTPESGLTEVHIYEAELKSKAILSASRVIALVDSSKFGKVDLTYFAQFEQIAHLYTDCGLSQEWVERLRQTCLAFTVCAENNASSFTPCSQQARHYRIGFANQSEQLPFAIDVRRGLERAASDAGNIDLVLADNQLNAEVALQVANRLLAQELDLVIEYQIDEATGNRIMSRFKDSGVPVIAVDIPMVGATFFGVDNYHAGNMAGIALGRWVQKNWLGYYDRLFVLEEKRAGALPASRIQGQLDGFQAILGNVPPEKLILLDSGNLMEVSQAAMEEALLCFPGERRLVILCFNDDAAIGALQAAHELNRTSDCVIIGQGADRRVRQELRRPGSRIIGSTAYWPERYGKELLDVAMRILSGEPVPPAVYIEHVFIDAENIAEYYPE
jgi:ribose transport system substrate-binding protein